MLKFKYFAFGRSVVDKDIYIIGRSFSLKDFYLELEKFSVVCQDPKANIFTVDEPTFNDLKYVDGVRII